MSTSVTEQSEVTDKCEFTPYPSEACGIGANLHTALIVLKKWWAR